MSMTLGTIKSRDPYLRTTALNLGSPFLSFPREMEKPLHNPS